MSNAERQQLFRARHPGYAARDNARRYASAKAGAAQLRAAAQAMAMKRKPLALPAPAEMIEIPAMNIITAVPSPLPLAERASVVSVAAKSLAA